jgi:hypothetical protein
MAYEKPVIKLIAGFFVGARHSQASPFSKTSRPAMLRRRPN